MSVLMPIPGSPDAVLAVAGGLEATASRMAETGTTVRGLGQGAVWDGPAGTAFAARLAELTPVLQSVGDRYAAAAVELRRLAPEMEIAQRTATAAIRQWDIARDGVLRTERLMESALASGAVAGSVQVTTLLAEQRRHVGSQLEAEAAHARAWRDYDTADERCSRALARLTDDAIADPGLYRLLHAVSGFAASVASLGGLPDAGPVGGGAAFGASLIPQVAAVTTLAGWVTAAADAGLLVTYDEGDWRSVGVAAGTAALGRAGGALKRGSIAGSVKTTGGKFVNLKPYTSAQRMRIGARQELRATQKSVADTLTLRVPERVASQSARVEGTWTVRARASLDRQRQAAARAIIGKGDDLRLAKAGGAVPMYAAGVTLERAAPKIKDAVNDGDEERRRPSGPTP